MAYINDHMAYDINEGRAVDANNCHDSSIYVRL